MRRAVFSLGLLILCASSAAAQAKKGIWQGTVYAGNSPQPLTVVLDSTGSGWVGAAAAPSTQSDSLRLVSVSVRADTLEFGIPYNGSVVYFSGLVANGKFSGGMWMNNSNVGSVELTRKADEKPAKP